MKCLLKRLSPSRLQVQMCLRDVLCSAVAGQENGVLEVSGGAICGLPR